MICKCLSVLFIFPDNIPSCHVHKPYKMVPILFYNCPSNRYLEGVIKEFRKFGATFFVDIGGQEYVHYIPNQINFCLNIFACTLTFPELYVNKQSCFKTPKFINCPLLCFVKKAKLSTCLRQFCYDMI